MGVAVVIVGGGVTLCFEECELSSSRMINYVGNNLYELQQIVVAHTCCERSGLGESKPRPYSASITCIGESKLRPYSVSNFAQRSFARSSSWLLRSGATLSRYVSRADSGVNAVDSVSDGILLSR